MKISDLKAWCAEFGDDVEVLVYNYEFGGYMPLQETDLDVRRPTLSATL